MEAKKIIIIGPAHPYRGGISSYNVRLAQQFLKEGHEVKIYTFTVQYPNFLFPGKTQFSEDPAPDDVHIERNINAVNPLNWIKVGNRIKKERPDILITTYWLPLMGPCLGTISKKVRKNKHTKIIAILHNVIPHEKRIGDKPFTKYFLKHQHAFLTMAKSVEEDLGTFDKEKPRTSNPHPLFDNFGPVMDKTTARKLLQLNPDTNLILFFGIIRDYKGLDLLLEAFSKMDRKQLNVKLLVAGEYYSNEEKYQNQIKRLSIEEDVIVVNQFIKDAEVGRYFCAADIVAQPYKSATQSGVTQIAYHFETPILVTNVGGLPEMVPDEKVGYVTSQSTEDIANALTSYFSGSREAEFKANLKVEKKKYTWDKLSVKILELSKKL